MRIPTELRMEIAEAREIARAELLTCRNDLGFWTGQLAPSALATATAVSALSLVSSEQFADICYPGLYWLLGHQNPDGGWGDTPNSPSNIATTMLVQSAFHLTNSADSIGIRAMTSSENYLNRAAGASQQLRLRALFSRYGNDSTFAAPILMTSALAGQSDWSSVPALPFEFASFSPFWLRTLRLGVVSYALPALIAVGQVVHHRKPSGNLIRRWLRDLALPRALEKLTSIQPGSGGFLEAIPLTSFVVMGLAASGLPEHPVASHGVDFLRRSRRSDGAWPIDSNLSVWVTTQAVAALAQDTSPVDWATTHAWLLQQQHSQPHPYTGTPRGGWAWTHLPGGVPDTDDSAGALLALSRMSLTVPWHTRSTAADWLLHIQNRDGGWPTFCRGWGRLPFDRSSPDLTAHAIQALAAWSDIPSQRARNQGFEYLRRSQLPDGSWTPLWFGNQFTPDQTNPVYGTARVLSAYGNASNRNLPEIRQAIQFLLRAQSEEGGWGAAASIPPSIEETALAVESLVPWIPAHPEVEDPVLLGASFLAQRIRLGDLAQPVPIGLYFAKLWYWESLYPVIWSLGALARVLASNDTQPQDSRNRT